MKTKIFLPLVFLAFLISAPFQVQAQSKRTQRKLKKEMRKLERQIKKVSELKQDAFVFRFDRDDFSDGKQLKELRELKYVHLDMEQQRRSLDRVRNAMDQQRHQLMIIRERYPDGIELPDIDIEIPEFEFEFEFPDVDIEIPELPEVYTMLSEAYESKNNLSINKTLKNGSVEKEHNYTVSDEASYLDMRVKGSVESGEVKIVLKTPKGEEYQVVELNSSADVNWNQKMKLQGENTDQYKGKWTISVKGNDVTGHFSIYMRSK